jgi:hypothetical protein
MKRPLSLVLFALAALACENPGDDRDSLPTSAPPRVSGPVARPGRPASTAAPMRDAPSETFGGGKVEVVVNEAGKEPRRELRYASGGIERDGHLDVQLAPPNGQKMRFSLGLQWKRSDGGPLSFSIGQAKLESDKTSAAGPQMAMFRRMQGGFMRVKGEAAVVDARHVRLTQTAGQATTPPVPWLVHAVAVPLPSEAVGVGASWTARHLIDASGRKGRGERRYTLTKVEGDELTIRVGGGDEWQAAGGRAQGTTKLSGEITAELSDPLPLRSDVTLVEEVTTKAAPSDKGGARGRAPQGKTSVTVRVTR